MPSKYRNIKTRVDGILFDSKKEAARWGELKLLLRAKEISDLQRQVTFPLMAGCKKVGSYRADFTYRDKSGELVIEDVKGKPTAIYLLKKKILAANGIEIKET